MWQAGRPFVDPDKLVFIDETGASTRMTGLYGRAPRGRRLFAKAPFGHWKTTTFVAALRRDGLGAPMVLDGPITGQAFLDAACPCESRGRAGTDSDPQARRHRRVGHLPAHKIAAMRAAIEAKGAQLFLLPPYSPGMNPIEMAFAKLKTCCARHQSAAATACGDASVSGSTALPQTNAPIASMPPDMATHSENALRRRSRRGGSITTRAVLTLS
jgi:hypothetical protein